MDNSESHPPQDRAEQMLSQIPDDGKPIGNISLRQRLIELDRSFWGDEDNYWRIRDGLVNSGRLLLGKGKGGSVRKIIQQPVEQPVAETSRPDQDKFRSESDLYEPMLEVIKSQWAKDKRFNFFYSEITAYQGSKATGGRWSRPDIIFAGMKVLPYVPGRIFELITFEIKHYTGLDTTAVYEALAHRRSANRSYVLIYLPDKYREDWESTLDDLCSEASNHGIGVIRASEPDKYDRWEALVEAEFHQPDPERMNDIVARQVSETFRSTLITWFK